MKIVCCIPSRGLVHSRTLEARDYNFQFLRACYLGDLDMETLHEYEKPIPEAQETIVERALLKRPDYVWMLEEDMVPKSDWLVEAVQLLRREDEIKREVALAPYKNLGGTWAYQLHPRWPEHRHISYGGIGCMLVSADALAMMPPPIFSVQYNYGWDMLGNPVRQNLREGDPYGGCEVAFYVHLHQAKFNAFLTVTESQHAILEEWGKPRSNQGNHKIRLI